VHGGTGYTQTFEALQKDMNAKFSEVKLNNKSKGARDTDAYRHVCVQEDADDDDV
jgi:hypothetical protein